MHIERNSHISFYELFDNSATKDAKKVYCRNFKNYNTLKELVNDKEFDGLMYVNNKETRHALVFDRNYIYAVSSDDLEKLLKDKNIYYQSTEDIKNEEYDNTFSGFSYEWAPTTYVSYRFVLYNNDEYDMSIRGYKQFYKKLFLKERTEWFFNVIFLTPEIIFDKEKLDFNETKLDHLFFDKSSELPLYREFFINKKFEGTIEQRYSDAYFNINYFSNFEKEMNPNVECGTIINLDKVSILKQSNDTYKFVNKNTSLNRYREYNLYDFGINEINDFLYKSVNKLNIAQIRLLENLKENYTRIYNRISKGLKEIQNKKENLNLFAFDLIANSRGCLSFSNLRLNDLSIVQTTEMTFSGVQPLLNKIADNENSEWVKINNCTYLNKSLLKSMPYEYSLESCKYYTNRTSLIIKNGKHRLKLINIVNENDIDILKNYGAFDEETATSLKCELILKTM